MKIIRIFFTTVFLLGSFLLKAQDTDHKSSFPDMKYLIGQHFPVEELQDSNGTKYSQDYLKGKTTFINFWFTNCEPCIEELPLLNKLKGELPLEISFLAVTFSKKEQVEKFLLKHQFDFEHITDMNPNLLQSLVKRYPMSFLIDKEGNVERIWGVVRDYNYDQIKQQISDELKKE